MDIRKIEKDFHVTGQIHADQLTELARLGYRGVICNRPDGEQPGQPSADEIGRAAEAAGLEFRNIPVASGQTTEAAIRATAEALRDIDGLVVAYCRSGARSANLYQAARAVRV
jgi:uncharacterized protein (TIGR01244 family)